MQQGAAVSDLNAVSHPEGPASPAGVYQPAGGLMPLHLLPEQAGVDRGWNRQERGPETGAEGDLGFFAQAPLGAGHLGSVTGEEMVRGLFRGQARDGRPVSYT